MPVLSSHFINLTAEKKICSIIRDIDDAILKHPEKKDDNSLQVEYKLPPDFTNGHFIKTIQKLYENAGWKVEHCSGSIRNSNGGSGPPYNYLVFTPK